MVRFLFNPSLPNVLHILSKIQLKNILFVSVCIRSDYFPTKFYEFFFLCSLSNSLYMMNQQILHLPLPFSRYKGVKMGPTLKFFIYIFRSDFNGFNYSNRLFYFFPVLTYEGTEWYQYPILISKKC